MLKSYEAVIENEQIKWLTDRSNITSARAIVTILEENVPCGKRQLSPASIVGKGRMLGDIVSTIINEENWECLKIQ